MPDLPRTNLIGPEPETIRALLRDHPALALTGSYLLVAVIGLTYDVLLFGDFGIRILHYADTSDFLLAAVREPVAIVLFLAAFPVIGLLRRFDGWMRRRWPRLTRVITFGWSRGPVAQTLLYLVSALLYAWLFTGLYAGWVSDRIKGGTGDRVVVELGSGEVLGDDEEVLLIGGTSRYVFVYDRAAKQPVIVPVESAARITVLSAEALAARGPTLPIPVTNNAVALVPATGTDQTDERGTAPNVEPGTPDVEPGAAPDRETGAAAGRPALYSFMGLDASKSWAGVTSRAFRFDGEWTEIAPVPGRGRIAATAQTVDGRVYLFGGYTVDPDGSEASSPRVDIYDPAADRWTRGADIPTPVDDAVSGVWRDSLVYLVSGWHDTANVRLVQVYDPAADRWTRATPVPGPGVFGHAGGVVGDVVVYIDGVVRNDEGPRYSVYAQAWRGEIDPDDPTSIDWRAIDRHPGPALYRAAAGVCGDRVLFAGGSATAYNYTGVGYSGAPAEPERGFLAYDTGDDAWLDLGELPTATMDHRGLLVRPTIAWILGGMRAGQEVSDGVVRIPLARSRVCVAP